jgi:hypothetical protein
VDLTEEESMEQKEHIQQETNNFANELIPAENLNKIKVKMTSKLAESSKEFLKPQEPSEELSNFHNQGSMRLESDLTQSLKKTLEPTVTAGMISKQELERNERQTMLAPDPSTTLKL